MAYQIDPTNGDLVITGFQNGIGSDPYSGLTDLKSVNPDSIANEASVSFSTKSVTQAPIITSGSGSVTTASSGLFVAATSLKLEQGQWIIFNSLPGGTGLSTNTPYYLFHFTQSGLNEEYQLFAATAAFPPSGSALGISASGAVTFSTIVPGLTKYFANSLGFNWMIDANGRVWSDIQTTLGGGGVPATNSWVYTGNSTDSTSNGNGIVCYQTVTDSTGGSGTSAGVDEWIFIWRNSQIDYTKITANGAATSPIITWYYGWEPSAGTTGNSQYLQTASGVNNSHEALVTPDGRVNYCDANQIGNFYQNVPSPGSDYTGFNPTTSASYTFSNYNILPFDDTAQCMSFLNAQLLIGGKLNIVYPWDLTDNTYSTPLILLPEKNVQAIITIGNNGYIFAGNRGWIYLTNGSQASPWKKVPDHISGAVEPLIFWGGYITAGAPTGTATFNKDRLYFGCEVTLQSGGVATGYGGIWCIDVNTGAMWNSNQMSYGSYAGYVSALIVSTAQSTYGPNIGYGLIAGWSDAGTPTYGIDVSVAAPYTGGQSYVISDAIPVGTLLKPMTASQIEFKLATPLKTAETVQLLMSSYPTGSFTSLGTITGTGVEISGNLPIVLQAQQWLVIQAILNSVVSSPSYNRLVQLRVIGDSVKTQVAGQPFGVQ